MARFFPVRFDTSGERLFPMRKAREKDDDLLFAEIPSC
jgi:hypothetical protein